MPKLSIENLKVTYGPIVGTDGVALTLEAGETAIRLVQTISMKLKQ